MQPIDKKFIRLSPDELKRCEDFAVASARTQQKIEFGQNTTAERSVDEIIRDTLIGKIAEVAFHKLMAFYGIAAPLDFDCYPRGKWDDQDAEINGWKIDIKGVREGGRWFLIEWSKLDFRQKENKLSHLYIPFTVGWDRNTDRPRGWARYEGVISLKKLNSDNSSVSTLRKGELLPKTQTALQADNYGILFADLNDDLKDLVLVLSRYCPSAEMTDDFKNPYTKKTTKELHCGSKNKG